MGERLMEMKEGQGLGEEVLPQMELALAGTLVELFLEKRVGLAVILGWLKAGASSLLSFAETAGVVGVWIERKSHLEEILFA